MNDPAPPPPLILTGLYAGPVAGIELPLQPHAGGECVFLGRTRAEVHPAFGPLLRLDYEAYVPMVEKLLDQLARDVAEKNGCHAVRIVHAVGPVPIGQASVVIQTLTAHRAAAFAACREAIDRLKVELPIWKREIWEDGRTHVAGSAVSVPSA